MIDLRILSDEELERYRVDHIGMAQGHLPLTGSLMRADCWAIAAACRDELKTRRKDKA
jgi:hypothetical protein